MVSRSDAVLFDRIAIPLVTIKISMPPISTAKSNRKLIAAKSIHSPSNPSIYESILMFSIQGR